MQFILQRMKRMSFVETDIVVIEQDEGDSGPVILDASRVAPTELEQGEFAKSFGDAVTIEFFPPDEEKGDSGMVILTLPHEQLEVGIPSGTGIILRKLVAEDVAFGFLVQ